MKKKTGILTNLIFLSLTLGTISSCSIGNDNTQQTVKKTIKSLEIRGQLTKTNFLVGENFDPTGLSFIAVFNDNSETDVSNEVIFSVSKMALTTTTVTATYVYGGIFKTATITGFTVESIKPQALVSIGQLAKKTYLVGEQFDPSGLVFYCKYNDSSMIDVTDQVSYNIQYMTLNAKVIASYKPANSSSTLECEVKGYTVKNYLKSLSVSGELTKKQYVVGDTFDLSGLIFTATFADNSTQDVTTKVTCSPKTVTDETIAVVVSYTYEGITKSVNITDFTVQKPFLTSLNYTGTLSKNYYLDGETLDLTGLTFYAHFTNGTSRNVTSEVTYNGLLAYTTTSVTVTYTYEGKSASCVVTGFEVDDPFNFVDGIDFSDGSVTLGSDNKTFTYKKQNSTTFDFKGQITESGKTFSNTALTTEINSGVSTRGRTLKFVKDYAGTASFYLGQDFINNIPDAGFSFDVYSTVAINSTTTVHNLTDGKGNIIYEKGHQHPINKWMTYTLTKDRINSDGKFLILNGSTQGTYYFDNIKYNTESVAKNLDTFYFKSNEEVKIDTGIDLRLAKYFELDNVRLTGDQYSVSGSTITLNNVSNGEHEISFLKKVNRNGGNKTSLYFGVYKASSKVTNSCSVEYGDDGYLQINELSNVNRIVYKGKSIAFEKSGMNTIIPNATLVECLETVGGKKVSGKLNLIAILGESNSSCKEIEIDVTVTGNESELTTRQYHTDETYHTFGYSATGGGLDNTDLIDQDFFMNYQRGGFECVYEQVRSISSGTLTEMSFYGGANDRVRRDLELCDKLGMKCYIIDSFMRNLINLNGQTELIGSGCQFSSLEDMTNQFYERLKFYAFHESLAKIVICDEPRYYNLVAVGQVYRALKAALERYGRSDIEVDANLLPLLAGWGSDDGLGNISGSFESHIRNYPKRTAIYKQYLKKFLDETGADYISYDIYPLWDGSIETPWCNSIDECAYSNLIIAAEFAKENNVELHVVTESFTQTNRNSGKNRREMSRDDIHWLCNQLMGFGVTRVSFFTYYNRAINSTEFSANGDYNNTVGCMKIEQYDENKNLTGIKTTQVYYNVQCQLEEMNEFKDIALNFKYKQSNIMTGSYLTQKQDATTRNSSYSYPVEWGEMVDTDSFVGPVTNITIDKEYCFTSTLTDKDGNYMYMVQNCCEPRLNSLQTATLTVSSGNYAVIYENGSKRVVKIKNNKVSIKIAPGNAAFVMIY